MAPSSYSPTASTWKQITDRSSILIIKTLQRQKFRLDKHQSFPGFSNNLYSAATVNQKKQSHKILINNREIYIQLITKIIQKWQTHSKKINKQILLLTTSFLRLKKKLELGSFYKKMNNKKYIKKPIFTHNLFLN